MKLKLILILTAISTLFSANLIAKDAYTKTSFKVSGNCDMCKERIENAAKTNGVGNAVWNEETHIMTVSYAPIKISLDQIQQNIAKAGYETEKYKGDKTAYENLPKCCQYKTNTCTEK